MVTSPPSNSICRRRRVAFNPSLDRSLTAYVLAGAAGLGTICSSPAQAAVDYTLAKVTGVPNSSSSIDLNHDGIADFSIHDYLVASPAQILGSIQASALNQNGVGFDAGPYAHAFQFGEGIGPNVTFRRSPVITPMAISAVSSEGVPFRGGEFLNQSNKFLGFKFSLNGNTYYGWARVTVKGGSQQLYYELIDYAYQNTPNTPIFAGQGIRREGGGSLGDLAFGRSGENSGGTGR